MFLSEFRNFWTPCTDLFQISFSNAWIVFHKFIILCFMKLWHPVWVYCFKFHFSSVITNLLLFFWNHKISSYLNLPPCIEFIKFFTNCPIQSLTGFLHWSTSTLDSLYMKLCLTVQQLLYKIRYSNFASLETLLILISSTYTLTKIKIHFTLGDFIRTPCTAGWLEYLFYFISVL